jgi:hypothetical protein
MHEGNNPSGVSVSANAGTVIPFASSACDEFAAHGSDVGIGPISPNAPGLADEWHIRVISREM